MNSGIIQIFKYSRISFAELPSVGSKIQKFNPACAEQKFHSAKAGIEFKK